jgi:hypothetical protein
MKMDRPAKLAFSDEATFTLARGIILIPLIIMISTFALTFTATDPPTVNDLALPCGAMSVGWFGWVGLQGIIAFGYRIGEKHAINRMFTGEIWECWQFSASEWQALVEADCNLISPKDEGPEAYVGAVYSSIVGIIVAIIIVAVGIFAIDDLELKTTMWIAAAVVFLMFLGAGLFQPMIARYNADRYRRKALRVLEPRVWFSSDGFYHETLGHMSLKELEKVTDQTRSRKAIQFTLSVSTDTSIDLVKYPVPVPSGCEERASRLVRCYRQEHIHK